MTVRIALTVNHRHLIGLRHRNKKGVIVSMFLIKYVHKKKKNNTLELDKLGSPTSLFVLGALWVAGVQAPGPK